MFQSISWQQYFLFTGFLLGVYYMVIVGRYFKSYFTGRVPALVKRAEAPPPAEMDLLQSLLGARDAMGYLFNKASKQQYPKEELLTGLKSLLSAYPLIKGSFFETALREWIRSNALDQCQISLSANEIALCW